MSTPLQRARTKLRVMYRLQQAAASQHEHDGTIEEGHEPGSPVLNGAAAEHPQVGLAFSTSCASAGAGLCRHETALLQCLSRSAETTPILGTAGGWQLLPLLTYLNICQLATSQAQHEEENPVKSLSLPLLPKLHPCRTDTLASEGAGERCGGA